MPRLALLALALALTATSSGCRFMKASAPEGPDGLPAEILIYVERDPSGELGPKGVELREHVARPLRSALEKFLRRRDWRTGFFGEPGFPGSDPLDYRVVIEVIHFQPGNEALGGLARLHRQVTDPVSRSAAGRVLSGRHQANEGIRRNRAELRVRYRLLHGDEPVGAGAAERNSTKGVEFVGRKLGIQLAEELTEFAADHGSSHPNP